MSTNPIQFKHTVDVGEVSYNTGGFTIINGVKHRITAIQSVKYIGGGGLQIVGTAKPLKEGKPC